MSLGGLQEFWVLGVGGASGRHCDSEVGAGSWKAESRAGHRQERVVRETQVSFWIEDPVLQGRDGP